MSVRSLHRLALTWALLVLLGAAPAAAQRVRIEAPADGTVSYRDRIAVIVRGTPGLAATLTVNGLEARTLAVRPDMKADFLNVSVPPGPVTLRVDQKLPNGTAFSDSVRIHVIGSAARVTVDLQPQTLPADGLSRSEARIRVLDAWGMPLPDDQIVTVTLDNGTIVTPDIYPEQPGVQAQVRGGAAVVQLRSPGTVGEGHLLATASDVVAEATIHYTTPYEKWTVVGMATGQIGWRRNEPPPAEIDAGPDYRKGRYIDGRAALFARGTVGNGYLLTMSYDSDRKYDDRVFRYLTPEQVYPIYGDASSIFYEAPSAGPLFARLERDRSYLQYGDFSTNLSLAELTSYGRSFTGASSLLTNRWTTWRLFGARTDQAIQIDELPGEGVSGHYYLSASQRDIPIVEGSERVLIQVRDRVHSELVLKEEPRYRFTDYEIDYEAGTLLFKRPVPSYSSEENPIIIQVTYETARSLTKHWVGGGRVAFHPVEAWELGGTVVVEEQTDRDYWLTGADMRWQPHRAMTLTSELARSRNDQEGWAWKVGAVGRMGSALGYDMYYREADRTFYNPGSPTVQPGVRKLRGKATWSPAQAVTFTGEAFRTEDRVNREERLSASLGSSVRLKALTTRASVEASHLERQGRETRATILNTGMDLDVAPWWTLGAERDQTFGDEDIAYRPTLTRLHSRWGLNDRVDLVAEHAFRDGSLIDSSFTAVGIQSRFSDDLTAYAKYEIGGGIGGQQNMAVVGLRHRYRPHANLTFHTAFERMKTLRGSSIGDFYAYSVAGEFLPPEAFKASGRFEQRKGSALDKTVASGAVDFVLARSLSLLAKHTYLDEDRATGSATTSLRNHHFLSGVAFRGVSQDYLNVRGKYEYKSRYSSLVAPASSRQTHIGSVEMILEPWSQVEWFGRYAVKVARLSSEGVTSRSLTDLWMTSLRLGWCRYLDVLGEYRLLTQHTARDYRHGAAFELGVIVPNTRLAFGYNFAGYQDEDFAGMSYWAHGPYLKIQIKLSRSDVAGRLRGLQSIQR